MLEARGARTVVAHAIRSVLAMPDEAVREATTDFIKEPPDAVIISTSFAARAWLAAADSWGIGDQLRDTLRSCRVLARGPKTHGALLAEGVALNEPTIADTTRDILAGLLMAGVEGMRIVVLPAGSGPDDIIAPLTAAGAEARAIELYRWTTDDAAGVDRLIRRAIHRRLEAVVFTSAPAVGAVLRRAAEIEVDGVSASMTLITALRTDVLACCIGPETARSLESLGITTLQPAMPRLGALVALVAEELPARRSTTFHAAGHAVEMRGRDVRVDGAQVDLAPAPLAVLRTLATRPGHVVSRHDLRNLTSAGSAPDDHAVEVTVARLRQALGHNRIVQTVVKRGYRLAIDT